MKLKEHILDRRFAILVCYVIAIVVMACYHEPWYDELQAWKIARENSPIGIFGLMKYEGHFMLWHMLLYPFAQAGLSSTYGLPIVSILLMAWSAWLLLYRSPFNTAAKILFLLSCPMLYYFPVVSRCYALIPPLLFLLACYYPKRMSHPIAYGICLGLLFNTHLYIEGLTITLLIAWLLEIVKHKPTKHYLWYGWGIALFLGLIALSQIIGFVFVDRPLSSFPKLPLRYTIDGYYKEWSSTICAITLFLADHGNTILYGVVKWLSFFGIIALFVWAIRAKVKPLIYFVIALVYQIIFPIYFYWSWSQRIYIPIFIMIFCLWISCTDKRRISIFATTIFLCGLFGEFSAIQKDVVGKFANTNELRHDLIIDNNHNTYINTDCVIIPICLKCYGLDTISNAIHVYGPAILYKELNDRHPEQFVLYTERNLDSKVQEKLHLEVLDSLHNMGYVIIPSQKEMLFRTDDIKTYRIQFKKSSK